MATIVERPMSVFSDMQTSRPPRSQGNRRESIEVIDVDAFDHAPAANSSRRSRPAPSQRRAPPETISLLDSDSDSEIEFSGPSLMAGHDVDSSRSHRRFISPRPPNGTSPSNDSPPPLPPLPQRLMGQTSFPMTRNPPAFPSPPPVVPITEPFAFENSMGSAVAGPSNHSPRPAGPRPSPRSHHLPSMGLGGALIANNRTQAAQRLQDRSRNLVRRASSLIRTAAGPSNRPIIRRHSRNFNHNAIHPPYILDELEDDDDYILPHIHMLLNEQPDDDTWLPLTWAGMTGRRMLAKEVKEKEQYQQSYTHPARPEPGFTFDFAMPEENATTGPGFFPPTSKDEPIILDDDDEVVPEMSKDSSGSSSSSSQAKGKGKEKEKSPPGGQISALLVCARCLDPLFLNAALLSDDSPFKRVWALRCGHMIDEKCLKELGAPATQEEKALPSSVDYEGNTGVVPNNLYGESVPGYVVPEPKLSIRSRLRSSHLNSSTLPPPVEPFPTSAAAPISDDNNNNPNTSRKRRRVSGTSKKSKSEEKFEWKCPVAGCGLVHVSVKVGGVWVPEKQPLVSPSSSPAAKAKAALVKPRGAIQVFA